MSDIDTNTPIMSLQNICKDYPQGRSTIEVLKDVSLDIMPGKMLAIIGASGSGKSTLLHIAGLLDMPTSGKVVMPGIDDKIVGDLKNAAKIRLENIGYIYQHHHLLPDFTALENVMMPLIIAGRGKEEASERAETLLARVGLGKRLYNVPGELSGGEMQRVAICRCLINKPKLILADEPTGNLDPHTAGEIFDLFLSQANESGAAIVMVTHNMELAAKMDQQFKLDYRLSSA